MGGKNATVVGASADVVRAAEGIARAAFGMSGQKCSACSRVVAVPECQDDLLDELMFQVRSAIVDDPACKECTLGPLIDQAAVQRYQRAIEEARSEGEVGIGAVKGASDGFYAAPAVAHGLPLRHRLTTVELFILLVTVTSAESFSACIDEANATDYGLTAGAFTRDREEQEEFLDRAEAGVLYLNRREGATTGAWPGVQSFCGWKQSGATGKVALPLTIFRSSAGNRPTRS
jgi:1-pyrroline-5-carboxylate dehydrogenase